MCELLTLFLVVGSYELSPGIMYVEVLNHNVVEEFIVPKEQYDKCSDSV